MKEITCLSGVELLMDYLEGVLSSDLHAELEAHVAGCARCVAFVASYRATPRILREATAVKIPDRVEVSLKTFVQRLLQKRSES
ncbi:MAG TPA: zf-HC2 domain-containing protein [Candidatus Eisenbacteria bacterium]|nr:zf-HC2 domain-containing protein [Candidatus Eisenbacteria bacterium]